MAKKLTVFIPEESAVGILINNSNVVVIKSNAFGISQHDLTTWQCFGQFLERGKLSNVSKKMQQELQDWISNTTIENREILINTIYNVLKESRVTDLKELMKLKPADLNKMFDKIKGIDENSKNLLLDTIKLFLIKPSINNN